MSKSSSRVAVLRSNIVPKYNNFERMKPILITLTRLKKKEEKERKEFSQHNVRVYYKNMLLFL